MPKKSLMTKIVCLLFFAGVAVVTLKGPLEPSFGSPELMLRSVDHEVTIEGTVVSDPQERYGKQQMVVEGVGRFAVLVRTQPFPSFGYGDTVVVRGRLEYLFLKKGEDEGYARYLMKDGIGATMDASSVKLVRPGGIHFLVLIFDLRRFLSERIMALFPSPDASLVLGVLLGIRSTMPQELLDDFQTVGLTHILAVSGYNITLVISIFALLLGRFGRRWRMVLTLLGILIFTVLTGMSPSVVRAATMGGLAFVALHLGRRGGGVQVLLVSAAAMVAANPSILLWDVSFQLSFFSTLGLLVLLPRWEKFFKKLPPVLGENLSVTLAATVFTTPIILYYFGRFSLISPLANVIFLPFIPALMLLSFLGLVVSFLVPPVAALLVGLHFLLVFCFVTGVALAAKIPFASAPVQGFSLWFLLGYYALLFLLLMIFRTPRLGRFCSARRVQ